MVHEMNPIFYYRNKVLNTMTVVIVSYINPIFNYIQNLGWKIS